MNQIQLRSEGIVLSSLLLNPSKVHDIMSRLSEDSFIEPRNKLIFKAAVDLYIEQLPIDTVSVFRSVLKQKSMYKAEAQAEVSSLISKYSTISSIELEDAIIYLISESIRNEHTTLGAKIMEMSRDDAYDPQNVLHFIQDHIINNKFTSLVKRKERTNEEILEEVEEEMKAARNNKGINGLETGFPRVDKALSGLMKTNFIIIAARPAMGKTQLVLGVYDNLSIKDDKKGLFFSCEMSSVQLTKRLISINGNIEGNSIRNGVLNRSEHIAFMNASKAIKNSSGKILAGSWHVDDLIARCHKEKNQNGLDYVIVDYIQLVRSNAKQNRNSEVEDVTNKLKQLANELEIPVIALAQLSRAVEQRPDKKPILSDLRDSGAIEQDADSVMFLYRPAYYLPYEERDVHPEANSGYVVIAKNRHGELEDILLRFDKSVPAWRNMYDPAPIDPQQEMVFTESAMKPNEEFDKKRDDLPF